MPSILRVCLVLAMAATIGACAPVRQGALVRPMSGSPQLAGQSFTSFDGARLGMTQWPPTAASSDAHPLVIVGVHGMNDYANDFFEAAPWWAEHGATVYAYDQRGFGRSPQAGVWPDPSVMRKDLNTLVGLVRARHGAEARIAVVGASMGAAVAVTAFAQDERPDADVLVLSGPGVWGWGALPVLYRVSLWASAHVRPAWVVVPPKGVTVTPTDNRKKRIELWEDPYVLKHTRIDSVYGLISIMEEAVQALPRLPADVPTLMLYGAKDEIIPEGSVKRAAKRLPVHVETAYYPNGYHMLLSDLQGERVWNDILTFIRAPQAARPSQARPLPWIERRDIAGSVQAAR